VILVFLGAIGVWSIVAGEFESVTFDKKKETMFIRYTPICCQKRFESHLLENIRAVRAVQRGRQEGGTDTINYVLVIYLQDGISVKVLQSR
jgi:hypothetical protein